jgi:hypothetical protein
MGSRVEDQIEEATPVRITWTRCRTYQEARDHSRIIYLHEWNGEPFYWGKAEQSFFGGHKRTRDGLTASGRYNAGYRHWIEGCLRHGGRLYVGTLDTEALANIDEIENFLIYTHGHVMNTEVHVPQRMLEVIHEGDVPASVRRRASEETWPDFEAGVLAWLVSVFQDGGWTAGIRAKDGYVEAVDPAGAKVIAFPSGEDEIVLRAFIRPGDEMQAVLEHDANALIRSLNCDFHLGSFRLDGILGLYLEYRLLRRCTGDQAIVSSAERIARTAGAFRDVELGELVRHHVSLTSLSTP